jgi:mRNA interferase MazF
MAPPAKPKPACGKVREHRERLRAQGLRPIQIWVPDVRVASFKAEAHRQSLAVAASTRAREDQAFIDAVSGWIDEWGAATFGRSGGKDYAGKPRPVVIVQDDSFDATDSITVCAFTTDETEAPLFRLVVEPNERNGLRSPSRLMVDKITTVPKSEVGDRIGRLDDEDVLRLNRAVTIFLGLAVSPKASRKGWR